jgi:hypothetical protein
MKKEKKKKHQQTHYLACTIQKDQVFIQPLSTCGFFITLSPQKSCNLQKKKKKNVTTKQYGNLLSQYCPLYNFFLFR